nr:hypothetical protein [Luteimonas sp. XNQY3]
MIVIPALAGMTGREVMDHDLRMQRSDLFDSALIRANPRQKILSR